MEKSRYGFGAVVFLVIALGLISTISLLNNKNSDKLTTVVNDLKENNYEMDKIDRVIQLLYKAENNSRLYIIIKDPNKKNEYITQLEHVSAIIDSIGNQNEQGLSSLVIDKRIKTELYIKARMLTDSLIRSEVEGLTISRSIKKREEPKPLSLPLNEQPAESRVVQETVTTRKSGKKFFERIKDAIVNKPQEQEIKKVTTIEHGQDTTQAKSDLKQSNNTTNEGNNATVGQWFALEKLSQKEKALLLANSILFQKLQTLLEDFKKRQLNLQHQRKLTLGKDAEILMSNLKNNNTYNIVLSIILTAFILFILYILYKNGRALQKAKLKAEEFAQYKSDFIATLSHEIRTPLHSIRAFTDELSERNNKNEHVEIIDAIKLSSNMLLSVTNNILDFTKMEKGQFKLNHSPFNPSQVIREVLAGLMIQAKRKNIVLIDDLDETINRSLYGDAFQLRQLLLNILGNAIKYTEKGNINLYSNYDTVDSSSGVLNLIIRDTGIGIESHKLTKIFDEYSSRNNGSEIREGSTGLGLSIVKRIIDYHKGSITVDSEINQGTVFKVKIPYDICENKEAEQVKNNSQRSRRILIVENDQLNIKYLNILLKKDNVSSARNGLVALEIFVENEFDLVITDISMPGLNGYELARKIRELPDKNKSSVSIIAISGFDSPDPSNADNQSDFSAWFVKPYDANKLMLKIDQITRVHLIEINNTNRA